MRVPMGDPGLHKPRSWRKMRRCSVDNCFSTAIWSIVDGSHEAL